MGVVRCGVAQHADAIDLAVRAEAGIAFDAVEVHHHGGAQHGEVVGALDRGCTLEDALALGSVLGHARAALELVGGLGAFVAVHQRDPRIGANRGDESALRVPDPQRQLVVRVHLHRAAEAQDRLTLPVHVRDQHGLAVHQRSVDPALHVVRQHDGLCHRGRRGHALLLHQGDGVAGEGQRHHQLAVAAARLAPAMQPHLLADGLRRIPFEAARQRCVDARHQFAGDRVGAVHVLAQHQVARLRLQQVHQRGAALVSRLHARLLEALRDGQCVGRLHRVSGT
jgi:hypothetical protein